MGETPNPTLADLQQIENTPVPTAMKGLVLGRDGKAPSATINLPTQHNNALVAGEAAINFIDGIGNTFTVADDPTNLRVNVTSNQVSIADVSPSAGSLIDIQNIPQTFKHLRLIVWGRETAATTVQDLLLRFNNDSTASYNSASVFANSGVVNGNELRSETFIRAGQIAGASSVAATLFGVSDIVIPNYTDTTMLRALVSNSYVVFGAPTGSYISTGGGLWTANAVNRITLIHNFAAGTRATLYGLG